MAPIKFLLIRAADQVSSGDASNVHLIETMPTATKCTASDSSSLAPSSSSDGGATMTKKERRLAMNRMSARLRRKRQRETVDKMQNTMRDLEMSNKRLKSDNDDLKRAIAELTKLCNEKKNKIANNQECKEEEEKVVAEEENTSVEDTKYAALVASALAKYNANNATEAAKNIVATLDISPKQTQEKQQQQQQQQKSLSFAAVPSLFSNIKQDSNIKVASPPPSLDTVLLCTYLINRQATLTSMFGPKKAASSPTTSPPLPSLPSVTKSMDETLAALQLNALAHMV